jgi:hypothetical protein
MAVDAEAKRTKIAAQFLPHFDIGASTGGTRAESTMNINMNNMARRTIQSDAVVDQTGGRTILGRRSGWR